MILNKNANTVLWTILVLSAITFLPFLGETLFNTKGEPREAIVAFSMLDQNEWILPVSCGGDIPYKPPFLAWLIAIISSVTGAVTEYTSRLPSTLSMIAMVAVGCRFFALRSTPTIALFSSLITITSFEVERAAMACRVDMVLTAFIVMAIYTLYCYFERRSSIWRLLLAILFMSCAVLTKGPIGMLLPCLVMGVFLLIRGRRFLPTFLRLSAIGLLSLIIPALWYIAAYFQSPEFLDLVIEENFGRFTGTMSYDSHVKPVYYNFITVIAGLAPYTLLLIFALLVVRLNGVKSSFATLWQRIRTMEPHRLLPLVAIVVIFTFYCIPESKRSVYLLPIYPFLAYFIAELAVFLSRRAPRILSAYGTVIAALSLAVAALFLTIKLGLIPTDIFHGRHAAENQAFLTSLATRPLGYRWIWLILAIFAAIGFFRFRAAGRPLHTFLATIFTTLALYWTMFAIYQPAVLNAKSDLPIARHIASVAPQGPVYSYIDDPFLRFYTINFYLGDRVKLFEAERPDSGLIIIGDRDLEKFSSRNPDVILDPIYHSPTRSCDHRQPVTLYSFSLTPQ